MNLKRSILYIDDEVECLNLFQEMFGAEHDVRTATMLAEARQMLAEHPANIVVSDQTMPEIKGTDFLTEVAAAYPSSYRVLITGSIYVGNVIPEMGAGLIHLFIPKPWTEQNMQQMFERASLYFELRAKGA